MWMGLSIAGLILLVLGCFFTSGLRQLGISLTGAAAIAIGMWFWSADATDREWKQKVSDLELKVKEAEIKASDLTRQLEEEKAKKVAKTRQKIKYINRYIDREVVKNQEVIKYVERCPLPKEIIDVHNSAADLSKELPRKQK